MNRPFLAISAALLLTFGFGIKSVLKKSPDVAEIDDESLESSSTKPKSKRNQRRPASAAAKRAQLVDQRPEFEAVNRDSSNAGSFASEQPDSGTPDSAPTNSMGGGYASGYGDSGMGGSNRGGGSRDDSGGSNSSSTKSDSSSSSASNGSFASGGGFLAPPASTTTPNTTTSNDSDSDSDDDTEDSLKELNCVSDVGTGTFSTPVNVNLTCSETASIKYCLSEGSCSASTCNPTNGSAYSSAVRVGDQTKSYCLSFYGEAGGMTSPTKNISYTFSKNPPNLDVTHAKIVYQTTQLRGQMALMSTDLPGDSEGFGVLNLVSHDPSSMSCEEIMDAFPGMSSPTPMTVMPLQDVSNLTSGQQLNVYLGITKLAYGDNWITSYHKARSFAASFSCESNKIVLKDFPMFEATASNAVVNVDSVMEFSGGFTPVGVFEETNLYRGPAGSAIENKTDQELRTGIFGSFFL